MSGEWLNRWLPVCFALSFCMFAGCSDIEVQQHDIIADAFDSDSQVLRETCLVPDEDTPGVSVERDGETNDGDQICDDFEANYAYDGQSCDQVSDCDIDGLDDTMEWLWRSDEYGGTGSATNPADPDTDGDGIIDSEDPSPVSYISPCPKTTCDVQSPAFEGRTLGVITGLELAGDDCCFATLDGDARLDNSVALILDSLSSLFVAFMIVDDPQEVGLRELVNEAVAARIQMGNELSIIDIVDAPAELASGTRTDPQLLHYKATAAPGATFEAIEAGDAAFTGASRSDGSPLYALVNEGNVIMVGGAQPLPAFVHLPIPRIGESEGAEGEERTAEVRFETFDLYQPQIRGSVTEETPGGAPGDQRGFTSGDTAWKVGGAVRLADIVAALRAESTLGLDADGADLQVELLDDEPGRLSMTCGETEPGTAADAICELVDAVFGNRVDVDTDLDGIADAISVGLLLRISGAALTTFE